MKYLTSYFLTSSSQKKLDNNVSISNANTNSSNKRIKLDDNNKDNEVDSERNVNGAIHKEDSINFYICDIGCNEGVSDYFILA